MFTTSRLKVKKKNWKKNCILWNTWNVCFKLPKIKGLIQIFASALEKYNYIKFCFLKPMPTIVKKECIKKFDIISQVHLHVVSFICKTSIFA